MVRRGDGGGEGHEEVLSGFGHSDDRPQLYWREGGFNRVEGNDLLPRSASGHEAVERRKRTRRREVGKAGRQSVSWS